MKGKISPLVYGAIGTILGFLSQFFVSLGGSVPPAGF